MNAETFCEHFATFADAPNGIEKLRELILQLAVQGQLNTQDKSDEPATALLERICVERDRAISQGRVKPMKALPPVESDELPSGLPYNWKGVRLCELVLELQTGPFGSTLHKSDYEIGGTPVINPASLKRGMIEPIDAMAVAAATVERLSNYKIDAGDILVARRGEMGRCAVVTDREVGWLCGTGSLVMRMPEAMFAPFVALLIGSPSAREYLGGNSVGTTMSSLNHSILARMPIGLPPLAEQRRIVEKVDQLLGLCDELAARQAAQREKRQRLVGATLDRLVSPHTSRHLACRGGLTASAPLDSDTTGAKANEPPGQARWRVMQDDAHRLRNHFDQLFDTPTTIPQLRQTILQLAVQGQLVPQDPNDEPAAELLGRIAAQKSQLILQGVIGKPSALTSLPTEHLPFDVPAAWKWIRLETVCEVITKGSSPNWQGVQYVDAADGVLFVTSENVGNYTLRKMDDPKYVERKFNEMEPRSILQRNDLLVNLVGASIGRSAIFDRDDPANINQAVGIIRLVRGDHAIDRWYLLHYLNSPISLRIMLEEQVETARANLSLTNMKQFLVPVPPLAEQKRIVTKVTELLSLCDALEAKLTQAESASTQLLSTAVHHLLNESSREGAKPRREKP